MFYYIKELQGRSGEGGEEAVCLAQWASQCITSEEAYPYPWQMSLKRFTPTLYQV